MNKQQQQIREKWKKKSLFKKTNKRYGEKSGKMETNGPLPPCRHASHSPGDADTTF